MRKATDNQSADPRKSIGNTHGQSAPSVVHSASRVLGKKRVSVEFFKSTSGNEPVREWLLTTLTKERRHEVGSDIRAVEYGWPVGMPSVRKLDANLWETRTTFKEGIARVFFTIDKTRMILL